MVILESIKDSIGVEPDNLGFDMELLFAINASAAELSQLGVSQFDDFEIESDTTWPEFDSRLLYNLIRHYMVLKTKLVFDPSASATISSALAGAATVLQGRIAHEVAHESEQIV